MQNNAFEKNYFYKYKKKRLAVLQDRSLSPDEEEPFHHKYLREQKEKEEKEKKEAEVKKFGFAVSESQEFKDIDITAAIN